MLFCVLALWSASIQGGFVPAMVYSAWFFAVTAWSYVKGW